jgi:hypothetical protein
MMFIYKDHQTKEDEIGWTSSVHTSLKNRAAFLIGKPEAKKTTW